MVRYIFIHHFRKYLLLKRQPSIIHRHPSTAAFCRCFSNIGAVEDIILGSRHLSAGFINVDYLFFFFFFTNRIEMNAKVAAIDSDVEDPGNASTLQAKVPKAGRKPGLRNRNKNSKADDGLDSKIADQLNVQENERKVDHLEKIRLKTKKFFASSFYGQTYDKFLLVLSILSVMEYIYSTYLHAHKPYQTIQMHYFADWEMALAVTFGMDWMLKFFLADRKITFVTR